jgi:hypothetical protein
MTAKPGVRVARSDDANPDHRGTAPALIRASQPSLPTGGGAIRGIGEKFSTNAVNGTGFNQIRQCRSRRRFKT